MLLQARPILTGSNSIQNLISTPIRYFSNQTVYKVENGMPQWIFDLTHLIFRSFHSIILPLELQFRTLIKKSMEKSETSSAWAYLRWPDLFAIRQHFMSYFSHEKTSNIRRRTALIYVSAQFTFIAQYQLISAFIINERTNKHKKPIPLIRPSSLYK